MKNKKGFTLVELLGVLVVLSVILMIAYPLITSYVRNTKEKAYEVQMELMLTSLKDYANEHKEWLPQNDGDYITLTLGQLKSVGIINNSVINPLDGKEIEDSMEFKITKNDTRYQYEIVENSIKTREDKAKSPSIELSDSPLLYLPLDSEYVEPGVKGYDYDGVEIAVTIDNKIDMTTDGIYMVKYTAIDGNGLVTNAYRTVVVGHPNGTFKVYENGKAIYFNPTTGEKCKASEAVSTIGTKSGCMKWYAFLDNEKSSKLKLLLDHNTTAKVAWNANKNGKTPDTAIAQLNIDTNGWKQIINGKEKKLTARLISANEINQIAPTASNFTWSENNIESYYYFHTGNASSYKGNAGTNKYAWLFDYTSGCTTYGCNYTAGTYGYWTSTFGGSLNAWFVRYMGSLSRDHVENTSNCGIRPVIEVDKSLFETDGLYQKYNDGTPLLYDPIKNEKCSASKGSTAGTNDGCMKWYTFLDSENSSTVNLILDHNTTAAVAWNSDTAGTTPATALIQLNKDVTNWNIMVKSTARLISANEINMIASHKTPHIWNINNMDTGYYLHSGLNGDSGGEYTGAAGTNTYDWLFDNTKNCVSWGCNTNDSSNYGYWTSSFISSGNAWRINARGNIHYCEITNSTNYGIRPVITVDKSIFE